MSRSIIVVGGGIGGLAAALGIARAGCSVRVLERAPEFFEIGAGLQLGPNASHMLDRLGVLKAVHDLAVFPSHLKLHDILNGGELATLDLGQGFKERYRYPYIVMHRGDLHQVLLAACRQHPLIKLQTRCEVIHIAVDVGSQRVECADGSIWSGDAIVGADGVRSIVRKALIDDGEPIDSGYVAFRGVPAISELTEHTSLDDVILWTGCEFHFVQYPLRRGELFNQVAVFRAGVGEDSDVVAQFDARFSEACERVRRALPTVGRARRWRLVDRKPVSGWSRGTVTLLGDAAHPMLQFLAQGACQALEDAVCLSDRVAACSGDFADAFAAYAAERETRTARVQKNARLFGDFLHADEARTLIRNTVSGEDTSVDFKYFDWLYAHRLDG